VVQILRVLLSYYVARAIGIDVSINYFFLFIPIIFLILMIPISIGGFGIREGASVLLFASVGVNQADAFMMGLLTSFVIMLYSIPGGLLFVFGGLIKKNEPLRDYK